jgi:hypothetical protein
MGALRETAASWMRMLTVTGDRSMTMPEQARLITEVNGPVQLSVRLRHYRWPWQRAVARQVLDTAGTAALTTLNWHLNAARLTTEHLIRQLSEATGKSRQEILQELAISIDKTIAAAEEAAGDADT